MFEPQTSCVLMAEACRQATQQGILQWVRQEHREKELVVVFEEGGKTPDCELPRTDGGVTRVTVSRGTTSAQKWRRALETCRGRTVAVWRAGDWMGPNRLNEQQRHLEVSGGVASAAASVAAFSPCESRAWLYQPSEPLALVRRTLLFRRDRALEQGWWEWLGHPDEERLPASVQVTVKTLSAPWYVALIRPGAAPLRTNPGAVWKPLPVAEVVRPFSWEDRAFYAGLRDPVRRRVLDSGTAGRREKPVWRGTKGEPAKGFRLPAHPPRVSCLMPTHNRREYVPQAIRGFLQQDYPNRELILVDDGSDSVEDLIPDDSRIHYVRLHQRRSTGVKRNLGCELAQGEVLVCWDDDDWHGPGRITRQVIPLLQDEADATALVTGHVLDRQAHQFWRQRVDGREALFRQGVIWGTLAWRRREPFAALRFPDRSVAEDVAFYESLLRQRARVQRLPNEGQYVYVRHGGNTWNFSVLALSWEGWEQAEPPDFMPPMDLAFYDFEAGDAGPLGRIAVRESTVLAT